MAVFDSMSDSKSTQSAFLKAKTQSAFIKANPQSGSKEAPTKDSSTGTWYKKDTLTQNVPIKAKLKKNKRQKNIETSKAEVIKDSLFHYQCNCHLCKDFDNSTKKVNNLNKTYANALKSSPKSKVITSSTLPSSGNIANAEFNREGNGQILKGGGKNDNLSKIFIETIDIAKNHGINLKPDEPNAAQGDCLFDSIIDNVNHRPDCFPEKFKDDVDTYRVLWVTELEEQYKLTAHYPGYDLSLIHI